MFAVEWLGHRVALRANNGKYVCTKKNGQLAAVSDSIGEYRLRIQDKAQWHASRRATLNLDSLVVSQARMSG